MREAAHVSCKLTLKTMAGKEEEEKEEEYREAAANAASANEISVDAALPTASSEQGNSSSWKEEQSPVEHLNPALAGVLQKQQGHVAVL